MEPIQTGSQWYRVPTVMVASMVLSPSSAMKKTAATVRKAERMRREAARRSSASVISSPRRVHRPKPRKAAPAARVTQSVGRARPRTSASSTLRPWTATVAAVIPASTVHQR